MKRILFLALLLAFTFPAVADNHGDAAKAAEAATEEAKEAATEAAAEGGEKAEGEKKKKEGAPEEDCE
ncbi:MAG: hypothetical protein R3179_04275 [Sedimenticolaceae bacterium]|nr:hypothetical protein [Sedimenticolaceae bacterium]